MVEIPKYPQSGDKQKPIPGVNMPRKCLTTDQIMAELERQGVQPGAQVQKETPKQV